MTSIPKRNPFANPVYRTGRHCIFKMHVHLVFVTKYRKTLFQKKHFDTMKNLFEKICTDFESTLVEFNGEHDHVHLLVDFSPKISIAKLVNSLKGVSSRKLKHFHPDLLPSFFNSALWSPSYFAASCGGAPLSIIAQYIKDQRSPSF